jgi:energy-converting hydrogenase B subunit Q
MDEDAARSAICITAENRKGILRDIGSVCAEHNANIVLTQQETLTRGPDRGLSWMEMEIEGGDDVQIITELLRTIPGIRSAELHNTFAEIFGKRVIILGGGAQVAQVAMGAVNEADRHNIRGERISVDTIPLVGEQALARAVEAVARLPRAAILVLAGSIMGGEITDAIRKVQAEGIPVIALKMIGTASAAADLVVTDPLQAGVLAVMHVSSVGVFDLEKVKGREL